MGEVYKKPSDNESKDEAYLELERANEILMKVFEETGNKGKSLYEVLNAKEHKNNHKKNLKNDSH